MIKSLLFLIYLLSVTLFSVPAYSQNKPTEKINTAYDEGLNPNDPMHKELMDILAGMPNMPGISEAMTEDQFFRPAFGPTLWRMILKPNTMKILFIGQDGTHIAEGAAYTATAGFGGRAQDVAAYLGQRTGAGFMNYSFFTITKQYGAFDVPLLVNQNGKTDVRFGSFVPNDVWLMTQDKDSLMAQKRNQLVDWIMRYHKDSLRMVVLFGGAARDSLGTFIESRGGKVGTKYSLEDLQKLEVPLGTLVSAGGNQTANVLIDKQGHDLYETLLGRAVNYKDEAKADLKEVQKLLRAKIQDLKGQMALTKGGIAGSGVIHPAQIGGYDLDKIEINGKQSRSLEGLVLSDGSKLGNVVAINSPHPTALSMMSKDQASEAIAKALEPVAEHFKKKGHIPADEGMVNEYAEGKPYEYGRTKIPVDYYTPGTPYTRMLDRSDAYRMKPDIVVLGTRDQAAMFDRNQIEATRKAMPAAGIALEEMFTDRPRSLAVRYQNDQGPGEKYMKFIRGLIDMKLIGKMKEGMTDAQGIDAYNVKSDPDTVGPFGHYRGHFKNAKILILADPDGYDDFLTSRALTGTRGQYLHGLMQDMGVNEDYLILKTVPFGMDGATEKEWETVLKQTSEYREQLIKEFLKDNPVDMIIADGINAQKELKRIVAQQISLPIVNIDRLGVGNSSGIKAAAEEIRKISKYRNLNAKLEMANIPRSHLPFVAKTWWGTSGDRVLNATNQKFKGKAFAIIVPKWASSQKPALNDIEQKNVAIQNEKLKAAKLPILKETAQNFYTRRNQEAASTATGIEFFGKNRCLKYY